MAKDNNKEGLFWTPLGGNNIDQFSGNCHYYNVVTSDKEGKSQDDGVIIDLGIFDNYDGLGKDKAEAAFADVRDLIKEKKAGAILLTHAHIDHIGAVAEYVKLGYDLPPIYAGSFTISMLKRSFADKKIPLKKWPKIEKIDAGSKIKIGKMSLEAVSVSHSVPDAFGFFIKTEKGNMFHTGDFKVDQTTKLGKGSDLKRLEEIGKEGVDAMVADATTVFQKGYAREEEKIEKAYFELIKKAEGRQVIVAASGGHMERYASIFRAGGSCGRTVVNAGTPYQISHLRGLKKAGYDITFGGKLSLCDVKSLKAKTTSSDKKMIVTSGSYRESSYLDKALAGKKAPFEVEKNALILVESRHVSDEMRKNAAKFGAEIITSQDFENISGSGHAQKEDMLVFANLTKAKMIAPTHCHQDRGQSFVETMTAAGFNVSSVPLNGMTFKLTDKGLELYEVKTPNWVISNKKEGSKWEAEEAVVEQKPSRGKGGVPFRRTERSAEANVENRDEHLSNVKKVIEAYKTKVKKGQAKKAVVAEAIKKQMGR
ncbi:MAG: MBL fold metallo-hydrolase [Alphaproteobacteria bacterium]